MGNCCVESKGRSRNQQQQQAAIDAAKKLKAMSLGIDRLQERKSLPQSRRNGSISLVNSGMLLLMKRPDGPNTGVIWTA